LIIAIGPEDLDGETPVHPADFSIRSGFQAFHPTFHLFDVGMRHFPALVFAAKDIEEQGQVGRGRGI
jgi:hypothetical protein